MEADYQIIEEDKLTQFAKLSQIATDKELEWIMGSTKKETFEETENSFQDELL